jgi:hypothetical protein
MGLEGMLIRATRKMTRVYGILGPAMFTTAIIFIIVGVVWAALHDQIF